MFMNNLSISHFMSFNIIQNFKLFQRRPQWFSSSLYIIQLGCFILYLQRNRQVWKLCIYTFLVFLFVFLPYFYYWKKNLEQSFFLLLFIVFQFLRQSSLKNMKSWLRSSFSLYIERVRPFLFHFSFHPSLFSYSFYSLFSLLVLQFKFISTRITEIVVWRWFLIGNRLSF